MTKKLSRREFLKGTGKTTAALAAIWAVGDSIELPEIEPMPEEAEDVLDKACHPYFCDGGVFIRTPLPGEFPIWFDTGPEVKR